MKKQFIYFASAVLAAGLAACSNDELEGSYSAANGNYEFTAAIEQPGTPAGTRVKFDGEKYFSWELSDIIGIFNTGDNKAYKYGFKDLAAAADGGFTKLPTGTAPTDDSYGNETETYPDGGLTGADYAFYPYSLLAETNGGKTTITKGEFYIDLDGVEVTKATTSADNVYTPAGKAKEENLPKFTGASLKMPMAGQLKSSGAIKFKNLTSLWKLNVKNIPAKYTVAVFENAGAATIAGKAKVDLQEQTLSVLSEADGGLKAIAYDFSDQVKEGKLTTLTFYFIVPAGDYPKGLNFYLDVSTETRSSASGSYSDTSLPILTEYKIPVQRNYLYEGTYTINGAGDGLESGEIARVNEVLADDEESVTVDMTKVGNEENIILPKNLAKNNTKTIKLVLNGNASSATKTITIMEDPAVTDETLVAAHNVVITNVSNEGTVNLNIQLPNSTVTLGDGTNAESYGTIESKTSEEALVLSKDVTVATSLTINGGNVFVKDGAKITANNGISRATKNADEGTYLIYQTKNDITNKYTSNDALNVVPEFVYKILTAEGTVADPIEATESLESLSKAIEVPEGANITIDLKGFNLTSSTTSVLSLAKNATVEIKNTLAQGQTEATDGVITSSSSSAAAVAIAGGSQLTLTAGTVKNTQGTAVSVTGEGSKFTLNGGTIASASGKDAVKATTNANVQLTKGSITGDGDVTLNGASSTTANNINISLPGALKAQAGANVVVNGTDIELAGDVTSNASTVAITAKSLKNLVIEGASSELTLNSGAATGKVTVDGEGSKFKLVGGSITEASDVAIAAGAGTEVEITGGTVEATTSNAIKLTDATATISGADTKISAAGAEAIVDAEGTAKSALTINGGTIETTKASTAAIKIAYGTDVVIKDGSITGTANAINITSGTLTVNGTGTPTLEGATTISAVPASGKTVTVKLDAAGATYKGSKDEYTVFNHVNSTNDAAPAIESITGGKFTSDIISDYSKHFIMGNATFTNCTNLEKNADDYFATFYTLGELDTEHYWHVYFHSAAIK
jgi:hypothetical protein